jgi:hypothetical protein
LINCPYCGQPVLEGQRFCGSCGKEVPAPVQATPVANNPPPGEEHSTPYAYSQPSGYGYEPLPSQSPFAGRMIIIIGAVILAVCCAFACGLLFGFEIVPDIAAFAGFSGAGPTGPTPRPTFTPTPSSLLPIIHYVLRI